MQRLCMKGPKLSYAASYEKYMTGLVGSLLSRYNPAHRNNHHHQLLPMATQYFGGNVRCGQALWRTVGSLQKYAVDSLYDVKDWSRII